MKSPCAKITWLSNASGFDHVCWEMWAKWISPPRFLAIRPVFPWWLPPLLWRSWRLLRARFFFFFFFFFFFSFFFFCGSRFLFLWFLFFYFFWCNFFFSKAAYCRAAYAQDVIQVIPTLASLSFEEMIAAKQPDQVFYFSSPTRSVLLSPQFIAEVFHFFFWGGSIFFFFFLYKQMQKKKKKQVCFFQLYVNKNREMTRFFFFVLVWEKGERDQVKEKWIIQEPEKKKKHFFKIKNIITLFRFFFFLIFLIFNFLILKTKSAMVKKAELAGCKAVIVTVKIYFF